MGGSGASNGDFTLTHFFSSQEDLLPPIRGMSATGYFPWLMAEMAANRAVAMASLEELPEAAARDRENLRMFGVQSNVTVPLASAVGRRSAPSASMPRARRATGRTSS